VSIERKILVTENKDAYAGVNYDLFVRPSSLKISDLKSGRAHIIAITEAETLRSFNSFVKKGQSIHFVVKLGPTSIDLELLHQWAAKWTKDLEIEPISVSTNEELIRVVNAIEKDSGDVIIRDAKVSGSTLFVTNCVGHVLEVDVKSIGALKDLGNELAKFKIQKYGLYISWLDGKIEMDYEGLRYLVDADFRREQDRKALNRFSGYGEAIAALRMKHKIKQSEIKDYDSRHIRRVEKNEQPLNTKLLIALAKAHGLSYEAYVQELLGELSKKGA